MSLFSDIGSVLTAPVTGGLSLLGLGGGGGGLFGGGGGQQAVQFNPDFSQQQADIDYLRGVRDREVTGLDASGRAELGLLDMDRRKALDDLRAAQAGRLATQQSQMALSGGLSSGAQERMANRAQAQGGLFAQGLLGDFAREGAATRARNLASQEQFRRQAALGMPQLSQGLGALQNQAGAANMQAQAAAAQGQAQQQQGLFGLIGGGIGAGLGSMAGNPMLGFTLGSGLGQQVPGIFGGF